MDWLVRLDIVVLGLLLAYTITSIINVVICYRAAFRAGERHTATKNKFTAELNLQVGNLKSVSCIAPYIGLVGTCLGILNAFSGVGMEKHAFIALMTERFAAALVPAATGILVTVPSICGYEYGRTRLELLDDEGPRRKLLLTSRFVLPAYSLIATYALTLLVYTFMLIAPTNTPKGFDVGIASKRCGDTDFSDRVIVLHIAHDGRVLLNFEEVDWDLIQNRLSDIYSLREQRVLYVLADEDVRFQTVADAIDLVQNAEERGTSRSLSITAHLLTPSRCPKPLLIEYAKQSQKQLAAKCTPRLVKQPSYGFDDDQPVVRKGERSTGYSPLVTFEVQESGELTNVVLKRSSGYSRIDRRAVDWVKATKYKARPGCGVIESTMTVDIHFGPAASNE